MIGALQQAVTGASSTPSVELSVFITPGSGAYASSNGSYTTPFFTSNPTGGVEPYSYEWSSDDDDVDILTPENDKTRVRISGYNNIKLYIITCKVTDNNGNFATANAGGSITFGRGEDVRP